MTSFSYSNVPADSDASWETYTLIDHQCGSVSLLEKYYKVVVDPSFPFEFIADTWGSRCFKNDETVLKL